MPRNNKLVKIDEDLVIEMISQDKKLNRIERIEAFYLNDGELSEEDERLRLIYAQVFQWYVKFSGVKNNVVEMMEKDWGYSNRQCWRILKQTIKLHGVVDKNDVQLRKESIYRNHIAIHDKALEQYEIDKDARYLDIAKNALIAAEKVLPDEVSTEKILPLPDYELSFDPNDLQTETEDIDYEEV